MYKIRLINLKVRLHEEVTPVGGISTPAANDSQPAITTEPIVVYGKDPTASNDTPPVESSPAPAEQTQPDRTKLYSQFKQDYKAEYETDFKAALDRRMKGHDKESAKVKSYLDPIMQHFELETLDQLQDMIDGYFIPNTPGYQQRDVKVGIDDDEGEPNQGSEAPDNTADLEEQATALTEKLSTIGVQFDLETELSNPDIDNLLKKGLSLEQAFNLAHHDELLKQATERQKQATIESIRSKGLNQVTEHASKPTPPVVRKADPSSWTDEEIKEVGRRAARENIYL